jgi:heme/copper-type cytochrome/quinol oxidase subunit 1
MKNRINLWVFSTNHKSIDILHLLFGLTAALLGTTTSVLMRVELSSSVGNLLDDGQSYNTVITSHGLLMIFYFITPIVNGFFGNWLVPIQLGCSDLLLPRLNNLGFWLLIPNLILLLLSTLIEKGAGTGWTFYFPLSGIDSHSGPSVGLGILALHLAAFLDLLHLLTLL